MSLLTRKYPFSVRRHRLRDSIVYGVIIWAILYLLQPFGFGLYTGNKFLVAGSFGLITSICYFIYDWLVLRWLYLKVKPWRIWHQASAILGLIFFIGIDNFLMASWIFHSPFTTRLFLMFMYWTVIIGVFMSALTTSIAYNRFLKDKMETLLDNTKEEQKDISITIHDTNVRANDLCVPINSLLYIEAQKNNVSVCYLKDEKPVSVEVHTTLSAVIENLKEYENIFQCHRSFVVNVNNITSAHGNSNGYQLTLGPCTNSIPVSRSYVARLKAFVI